ncbi:MAG: IS1 family transposase [Gloeotrichia echinulata GP01]
MNCPKCNSKNIVKNGHTHYGKQRFKCRFLRT